MYPSYSTSIRTAGTLGRDESLPGAPFIRLMNPTDFDNVREAMRITIKEKLDWDLFNPLAWKTIGLSGGPIDKFLMRYKELATQWKVPYQPADHETWKTHLKNLYGYDDETIDLLLSTFWEQVDAGKVPDSLYRPWTYEPVEEGTFDKYFKMGLKYAVVGGVVYLVIKSSPQIVKGFTKKK